MKSLEYSQLTAKYIKQEYICAATCIAMMIISPTFLVVFNVLLETNKYNLPLSVYIIFLPFEGFSMNWWINFFWQNIMLIFNCILLFSYITLSVVFLNHACLTTDIAIYETRKFNLVLNDSDPAALVLGRSLIKKKVEKLLKRTQEMVDWHSKIQNLMRLVFLGEFSLLSSLFCMCLYVIVSDVFGSNLFIVISVVALSQLFLYCWMGSRIYSKVQNLAATIYEVNWDLMTAKQRKDFLLILMNVQNVKHLNGVFNDVSLETFKKVRSSCQRLLLFQYFYNQHRSWTAHTVCSLCSSLVTKEADTLDMDTDLSL